MAAIAHIRCSRPLGLRNVFAQVLIVAFMSGAAPLRAYAQATQSASSGTPATRPAGAESQAVASTNSDDDAQQQLLTQGSELIKSGRPADAVAGPIAQVIAHYENGPGKDRSKRHYCARTPAESLLYLAEAAKDHLDAVVLSPTWANAYFFESSALTDLGRIEESQAALHKALELSPWNSWYLSELGYTYEMQHDFDKALEVFQQAEAAANFSPDNLKTIELTHALRGEGYALTELRRLDEAESKYHKALKLDPNDQKSKNELEYIGQLRAKSE